MKKCGAIIWTILEKKTCKIITNKSSKLAARAAAREEIFNEAAATLRYSAQNVDHNQRFNDVLFRFRKYKIVLL